MPSIFDPPQPDPPKPSGIGEHRRQVAAERAAEHGRSQRANVDAQSRKVQADNLLRQLGQECAASFRSRGRARGLEIEVAKTLMGLSIKTGNAVWLLPLAGDAGYGLLDDGRVVQFGSVALPGSLHGDSRYPRYARRVRETVARADCLVAITPVELVEARGTEPEHMGGDHGQDPAGFFLGGDGRLKWGWKQVPTDVERAFAESIENQDLDRAYQYWMGSKRDT